jgi:hypothetical protein
MIVSLRKLVAVQTPIDGGVGSSWWRLVVRRIEPLANRLGAPISDGLFQESLLQGHRVRSLLNLPSK